MHQISHIFIIAVSNRWCSGGNADNNLWCKVYCINNILTLQSVYCNDILTYKSKSQKQVEGRRFGPGQKVVEAVDTDAAQSVFVEFLLDGVHLVVGVVQLLHLGRGLGVELGLEDVVGLFVEGEGRVHRIFAKQEAHDLEGDGKVLCPLCLAVPQDCVDGSPGRHSNNVLRKQSLLFYFVCAFLGGFPFQLLQIDCNGRLR